MSLAFISLYVSGAVLCTFRIGVFLWLVYATIDVVTGNYLMSMTVSCMVINNNGD